MVVLCLAALLVVIAVAALAVREGAGGGEPEPEVAEEPKEPEAAVANRGESPDGVSDEELALSLWSRALEDGRATRTEREFAEELPEAAATVLEELRQGSWSLLEAGYVDLFGRCWGCVALCADEVQVCVVSERDDGTSHAEVLHLCPDDWAADTLEAA